MSNVATYESVEIPLGWSLFVDRTDSLQLKQMQGVFEAAETRLCTQLIEPGACVVDVGANIGYYTKLFTHLAGSTGIVHAFEPSPDNLDILTQNLQTEVSQGVVQIHPIALGEHAGLATLHLHEKNAGKHRMYPSVVCKHQVTEIEVQRGDSLDLAPIDFLKIDVEGYEFQALSGLCETLYRSHNLTMLMEFAPASMLEAGIHPKTLIQFLVDDLSLHCLRPVTDGWTLVAAEELMEAMRPLDHLETAELTQTLTGYSDLEIEQRVSDRLYALGFRFPLLENQLWVTSTALKRVLNVVTPPGPDRDVCWLNAIASKESGTVASLSNEIANEIPDQHLKTLGYCHIPGSNTANAQDVQYQRKGPARWTQYWLKPEHSALWNSLFTACFGAPMPESLLQWKYHEHHGIGLGAYADNGLIGFIGGIPREVLWKGQSIAALQVCDVMVHPKFRHLQSRHGVFQQMAERFLRTQIGFDAPYRLGFGFPSQRAFKLAECLHLYAPVDSMVELIWPCRSTLRGYLSRSRLVQDTHADMIDHLGDQMHRSFHTSILGKRSWAYLQSRYLNHPQEAYVCRLILSHGTQRPLGVLIFKSHENGILEWVDVIAPQSHLQAMVHAALRFARCAGFTHLYTWISYSHHGQFNVCSPEIKPLDIIIPAYDSPHAPPIGDIMDTWFLMPGDSDFH